MPVITQTDTCMQLDLTVAIAHSSWMAIVIAWCLCVQPPDQGDEADLQAGGARQGAQAARPTPEGARAAEGHTKMQPGHPENGKISCSHMLLWVNVCLLSRSWCGTVSVPFCAM